MASRRSSALALLAFALCASGRPQTRRTQQQPSTAAKKKRECEDVTCARVHLDHKENCVLRCQSEACYEEIFMPEELEPGEIDTKRQRAFQTCLNAESRRLAQERRSGKKTNRVQQQQEEQDEAAAADEAAAEPEEQGGEDIDSTAQVEL